MPEPQTLLEAQELIRKSGLIVETARFIHNSESVKPLDYFQELVKDGHLTSFQARHLARGRWKGLVLGNYQLLERLGSGGMGSVYLGRHTHMGRLVAVKVLTSNASDDPMARERMIREARAAAALNHPNIIQVYDIEMDHTPPYLVLEYAEGVTLQRAVSDTGTLKAEEAAYCGIQVARGLQHAWEKRIVHRDIKPSNLMLGSKGEVRILDLGIVRITKESEATPQGTKRRLVLGTLSYLAPEQFENSSIVDCRADIYSLGATLYFLLAGQPPWDADDSWNTRLNSQSVEPEAIHELRPDVPVKLSKIIQRMIDPNPDRRYQTPTQLLSALNAWTEIPSGFPEAIFARIQNSLTGDSGHTNTSIPHDYSSVHPSLPESNPGSLENTAVIMFDSSLEIRRESIAASPSSQPSRVEKSAFCLQSQREIIVSDRINTIVSNHSKNRLGIILFSLVMILIGLVLMLLLIVSGGSSHGSMPDTHAKRNSQNNVGKSLSTSGKGVTWSL